MYYKIVSDDNIILDVIDVNDKKLKWVKWDSDSKEFQLSNAIQANGLLSSDGNEVYCVSGKFENYNKEYQKVLIIEIFEEEYNSLLIKLKTDFIDKMGNVIPLEIIAKNKITKMSNKCQEYITNGFNIVDNDNVKHHYSLSLIDQINIERLWNKAQNGHISNLVYHADGENYRDYSVEEINLLYEKMEELINYHTMRFNSLKMYILGLQDKSLIKAVNYEMDLSKC